MSRITYSLVYTIGALLSLITSAFSYWLDKPIELTGFCLASTIICLAYAIYYEYKEERSLAKNEERKEI